jgi:nicotinamidase-related amidase
MAADHIEQRLAELGASFDPAAQALSERWGAATKRLYESRGIGVRTGFGAHPALIVVDMSVAFCDPSYKVGSDQTPALEAIAALLDVTRECRVPSFFFTIGYHADGRDAGMFGRKVPALLELQLGDPGIEIHPTIKPRGDEMVITKKFSSCFFQTNLTSLLVTEGVDTVILTGCSTSGCVRATALDAVSYGYRVVVPVECVCDRAEGPHLANLFDIDAKYGDVMPLAEVVEQLRSMPADPHERMVAAASGRS